MNNYITNHVSIIIPNYNGEKVLYDCLDSLYKQTYKHYEIIVIDDCSQDSSIELIENTFNKVKIIKNSKNYGFSKTVNEGIKVSNSEYIALLNSDTKVNKDWLLNMINTINTNNNIGMCASKVLFSNEPNLIDSVGVIVYPDGMSRTKGHLETDNGQYDKIIDILLPSGCSALYRRNIFDTVGMFDEDFVSYCEDTDLGLRIRLAGWKAVFSPDAITYHLYSNSSNKYSEYKAFLVERNHLWVAVKNFPIKMLLLVPFYKIWRYFMQIYSILINKGSAPGFLKTNSRFKLIIILLKANISALIKLPIMIKKRSQIKKFSKILDNDFMELINKFKLGAKELVFKN